MFGKGTIPVSAVLAGTLFYVPLACAQGRVEVTGYGGGITMTDGGTNTLVGGTLGVRAIGGLRVFGDFGYSPLGAFADNLAGAVGTMTGLKTSVKGKVYNYSGGVDYSFTRGKAAPYVIFAMGGAPFALNASAVSGNRPISVDISQNMAFVGLGGGVRIFAGKQWGLKPEFRYQRYGNSDSYSNSALFTAGLFYQFGK